MTRLVITARAREDLVEIWEFSVQRFGEKQADRYLDELEIGLRSCAGDPSRSQLRPELGPKLRSRLIGRHVAFHRVCDEGLVIVRVLHASMDPQSHLGGADPIRERGEG